jgi:hypothetical protein
LDIVASSAANLGAAAATQSSQGASVNLEGVIPAATNAVQNKASLNDAKVLWVDDNPDNNLNERQFPHQPPLIIYSSSSNPEYRQEAIQYCGIGETNNPVELYDMVVKAIVGS